MQLSGERLSLRLPHLGDIDLRQRWFADPEVTKYLPMAAGSRSRADVEAYILSALAPDRAVLDFSIELHDGRTIGSCSLRDFDDAQRAELGLVIGERWAWGAGYGEEAMRLLITHGFNDLGLNAIWLRVRPDNTRAVRLYERIGMHHDGRQRAAVRTDGGYIDMLLMSVLASEWPRYSWRTPNDHENIGK